jgi:hypothetical protein
MERIEGVAGGHRTLMPYFPRDHTFGSHGLRLRMRHTKTSSRCESTAVCTTWVMSPGVPRLMTMRRLTRGEGEPARAPMVQA